MRTTLVINKNSLLSQKYFFNNKIKFCIFTSPISQDEYQLLLTYHLGSCQNIWELYRKILFIGKKSSRLFKRNKFRTLGVISALHPKVSFRWDGFSRDEVPSYLIFKKNNNYIIILRN